MRYDIHGETPTAKPIIIGPWFGIYQGLNVSQQGNLCLVIPKIRHIIIFRPGKSEDFWGPDSWDSVIGEIQPLETKITLENEFSYAIT